jgi:outer membrane protein
MMPAFIFPEMLYMKKIAFIIVMLSAVFTSFAQDSVKVATMPALRFAYFSYEEVLHSMGDYAIAQHKLMDMRSQYETELKRAEDDFNVKYEDFLAGQRDFAPSILRKRQSEIQEMLEKNKAFKTESLRSLKLAEEQLMAPVREHLQLTLRLLGKERGYAFILNIDNNTVPYIDSSMGDDVTGVLKNRLR